MSFLAKQLRRMDVVGEILYNSCSKIKTVKHTGRTMAPRIPPNANINVRKFGVIFVYCKINAIIDEVSIKYLILR